ncbi:MAG TPA: 6-pyruvoyl-tetrahydropterin synthase-related protein [Pyrinomonadaceae bacterium]|nr:6-pyruvoyl-tetrahydropterin synthase-related protein [Pyrinomonadaceae bacterium]
MKSALSLETFFPPLSISSERALSRPERAQDLRFILVVAIVAVVVLLPIIIFGIPNGADLPNHFRFAQPFYESIQSGHWHPGWLAESNDGFGDLRFSFYPPGLYYLLATGRMLTGNWYAGSIAAFVFLSVIGGLGAYFWARAFCPPKFAMWAGVLYTIAPYHLNELYQASLLSEYAACAILPFAFAFTERVCRDRKVVDVAGLAAAYALLVLSNLPLAVIGSISLAIYAALRIERKNFLLTVSCLAMGICLGLAASAFFWTTMLAELPWIKGNSSDPNIYYNYRVNFLFSPAALANRNTWYANILALALIGFLLPGIALTYRFFKDRTTGRGLKAVLLLSVTTFLMATALSRPVWAMVPKLAEIQFPWRWLAITSLAGCLLVATSIPKWKEIFRAHLRPRDLAVALAFALSLVFVATQIVQDCEYLNRSRFDAMTREIRGAPSFKDWLPVAAHDLLHLDLKKNKVDAGSRSVTLQSWEPERRQFRIAAGPETEARVRTFYYPHWIAKASGQRLATRPAEDGAILISVPPNASDITLEFQEPSRVHKAELFSAISWILIAALLLSKPTAAILRERSGSRERKLLFLQNS